MTAAELDLMEDGEDDEEEGERKVKRVDVACRRPTVEDAKTGDQGTRKLKSEGNKART